MLANISKDIIAEHLYAGSYIALAALTLIQQFFYYFIKMDINQISVNKKSYVAI